MKAIYLILTIIIIIFIAVSLSTSVSFSPYFSSSLYRRYAPYEGFTSGNMSYGNIEEGEHITAPQAEFNNKKKANCKKVFGFNGLYCDPSEADTRLDYFADAKGDFTCEGSGMSNSKGSLCLDKTMTTLLTTRGGNAKGGETAIGH